MAQKNLQAKATYIIGNWKMYKTIAESVQFIEMLNKELPSYSEQCKIYLAVPFTALKTTTEAAAETPFIIGAQNMNSAEEGAFTGEIAAKMLKDAGARFVILGHSERRRLFAETNAHINSKVRRAIQTQLQPILCIGETYEQRDNNETNDILQQQIVESLSGIDEGDISDLMIAYEPVWAVGTGKAATPEIVSEVHAFIRSTLASLFPSRYQNIPLLYGGSVSEHNSIAYLAEKDIDGLLIGTASLYPETFARICQIGQNTGHVQERV